MGNCLFNGMGDGNQSQPVIKVTTANGGVMEFYGPVSVESITDEFPGHGIFRSQDLFWKPLPHSDILLVGESYHLLPVLESSGKARAGHVRSNSAPPQQVGSAAYRMSVDSRSSSRSGGTKDIDAAAALRRPGGFWKVKLVISPEQLLQILAEEGKTEELIESVRTVAKCGSGFGVGGFSDHWSLSSSRNAASSNSNKDTSLLDF